MGQGKTPPILGIDFGTTLSSACLRVGKEFKFIKPPREPSDLMPSVVCFKSPDEILVGEVAIEALTSGADRARVVQHVKRQMRENFGTENREPKTFEFFGKKYSPAAVAGKIIKRLKDAAETEIRDDPALQNAFAFDGKIHTAVITVPAQFGRIERRATELAAKKFAGFSTVHLLEEPLAAALSLNLDKQPDAKLVLVIDLGGGTYDVTLLMAGTGVSDSGLNELGRIGDNELGGIDWDLCIAKQVVLEAYGDQLTSEKFEEFTDFTKNYRLFQHSETAKFDFCDESRPPAKLKVAFLDDRTNRTIKVDIGREWFFKETAYMADYCATLCEKLFAAIPAEDLTFRRGKKIGWQDIDHIEMVGGGSRMPAVRRAIEARWKKKPHTANRPQHAVAEGAALAAERIARGETLTGIGCLRSPHAIGVIRHNRPKSLWRRIFGASAHNANGNGQDGSIAFSEMIPRNSRLPTAVIEKEFLLTNPDARTFQARICEQRISRFRPDGYIVQVEALRIPDLPPPAPGVKESVLISVEYGDDHELKFVAHCRGKTVPLIITEEKFEAASDEVFLADAPR